MRKRALPPLLLLLLLLLVSACSRESYRELGEEEIKALLSDVVASQQSIEEAGLRYFNALSAENNFMVPVPLLEERLARNERLFLLDIRREADYKAGHIAGAENIWWFDLGRSLARLPADRPIVVYCYSGQSAGQVVGALQVMGYDARSLAGGMNNGWLAAKKPVVSAP